MIKRKNIEKLEVILENTETFKIDGKHIGTLGFLDIKKDIRNLGISDFCIMEIAQTVVLEIHKNANTPSTFDPNLDFFTRICRSKDITGFEIDGETLFPQWVGDNDYINPAQKTQIGKNGNLYIVISKDKKLEDYFKKTDAKWGWIRPSV